MGKYDGIDEVDSRLEGSALRIGLVVSRFNRDIVDALLSSCRQGLVTYGVLLENVTLVSVPGALEIPLALRKMALSKKYDALVAMGAVIRGDTYHFEIVSNEMASGITRVQLDTGIPIANAVLTTENEEQAHVRTASKGKEAACCAIEMANLLRQL